MTYNAKEISIQEGTPFFLYQFSIGATIYRYVDLPDDLTFDSQLWLSRAVKHTEVKQANELSKNGLSIEMPLGDSFTDLFLGWSPETIVSFTLYRGHIGETEYLVYWKGRVTGHKLKDEVLEFNCESIFTSLRRSGVRARYVRTCRHSLYGRGCNLDKSSFAINMTLDSYSALVLTVPDASGYSDGWFTGGIVEFPDGSYRSIRSHVGNQITITRASRYLLDNPAGWGLSWGSSWGGINLILYPGCDRTLSTCDSKFNNLLNQGGFRWIPSKNPMGGSSIL
jgi:uncharacterized phage protein (TIGR02218 family)